MNILTLDSNAVEDSKLLVLLENLRQLTNKHISSPTQIPFGTISKSWQRTLRIVCFDINMADSRNNLLYFFLQSVNFTTKSSYDFLPWTSNNQKFLTVSHQVDGRSFNTTFSYHSLTSGWKGMCRLSPLQLLETAKITEYGYHCIWPHKNM